ncbi:uncharacterized protein CC84DRAFT_1264656 [Paraphaeosphaeria sporulosa]|uniref:DUF7730 domain-containing protein n=1 Tax=Paraphaeosphaeria sporulosa TaxID=1460663 RepID=A0A177BXR2_9PLEO|nr:uncharacterized protein CC84DRAFT_1264656 [Paraphaeosphaeria sporulosa]OAF99119.1 hypothetical protein CC84DRAFT_1264656 [Paraphaeosphaeria sporulosa]
MANAGDPQTAKTYPRVRFLPNGLLDVDRKKGKYFKMVQQNQLSSPLLQLPGEIRSTIYEYVLGDETFTINPAARLLGNSERKKREYLALLQVSRQTYVETVLMPFKLNVFHSDCPQTIRNWMDEANIPIAAQQTITRLQFTLQMHWHAYIKRSVGPFKFEKVVPGWSAHSGAFDQFPALRQIYICTALTQCYCDKPKAQQDALIKYVEKSEEHLKTLIKRSHKATTSNDLDIIFERDLNFALAPAPLDILDVEGDNWSGEM